jgi:hypothetical protein
VIGFDVGGCYDLHARAVARHLTKHIPDNPVFVPQNRFDAAKPNWIGNPTVDNLGHDRGPRMAEFLRPTIEPFRPCPRPMRW